VNHPSCNESMVFAFFNEELKNFLAEQAYLNQFCVDISNGESKFDWSIFLIQSKKMGYPITGFDGYLKRLKINNTDTNTFFFFHWFDKQIPLDSDKNKRKNCIINYIESIVSDIRTCLSSPNLSHIDLRIILHEGDYLNLEHKNVEDDIKELLKAYKNVKIYSFRHEPNALIFDRVLNSRKIIEMLKGLNPGQIVEEYILSQFDPDIIDTKFAEKLRMLTS
jgi:hypothetical protein